MMTMIIIANKASLFSIISKVFIAASLGYAKIDNPIDEDLETWDKNYGPDFLLEFKIAFFIFC